MRAALRWRPRWPRWCRRKVVVAVPVGFKIHICK